MASKHMTDERLAEQRKVVEKAINGKMLNKYEGVMLSGDNSKIIKAISGELRNTHQAVFKSCLGKDACEHCGTKGNLDRAHTKGRMEIAKEVMDELHPEPNALIDMKVFMKAFVMLHSKYGVWMLCKKCHKELG
jgi:hypothetical protein